MCCIQGILLFTLVAIWGHPEEAIALAFAVTALIAVVKGRWRRAGWLLGLAIAFQPYTLLLLPMMLGLTPKGRHLITIGRAGLLSCALVVLPLFQDWHATAHAIFVQPTYLRLNHSTPLLALAPQLTHGVYSAGPSRYLVVLCAVGAGWWTWRRQPGALEVIWLASLVFIARCIFEPIVTPYYVWAGTVLLLTVAASQSPRRFSISIGSLAFAGLWAYRLTMDWLYWLPIVAAIALALVVARPVNSTIGLISLSVEEVSSPHPVIPIASAGYLPPSATETLGV